MLHDILPEQKRMDDFVVKQSFPQIGQVTMLLNARQVSQSKGTKPLILLAIEDITARNQAEDLLREANKDLQHFTFAVSHDLQEPLRTITTYSQLLARDFKGTLGETGDRFLGFTVDGAKRMDTLLKGLRDYWAVNEEGIEPAVVVNCGHALHEALKILEMRIQESGAVITHDLLPSVRAEEVAIMLLFQNLIGNAIKYARPGVPPQVHVSVKRIDDCWHFSLRDNGLGIEAKYLKLIFAPFKRLHGKNVSGSGLGLAICRRIVERYKGRLWVESTEGLGSTFHFTIPA